MTSLSLDGPPRYDAAPVLTIRGLEKRFILHSVDGRTIDGLRGVDLDVFAEEHVCLAGLSGAGKSSLLKSVHRTYVADAGSILYRRGDVDGATGPIIDLLALDDSAMADLRSAEIGYVSQFLRAEPRRGVLDVVSRAAIRRGIAAGEASERAVTMLRRLNIDEDLWASYPTLLSGGEKQRVNLAAGIVVAPRLLLLDEPVSALDPANRAAVLDVIADLTARGATVLSVFHDLPAIRQLADRVVLMADGRVVEQGAPNDVLDRMMVVA